MSISRKDPVLTVLTAAVLLLVLVICAEIWLWDAQTAGIVNAADTLAIENEIPDTPQTQYVHPDLSRYGEALARPAFFASRQMPEPPPEQAPAPAAPLRLRLEGVAIAGVNRVAVLRDLGSNQLVQLSLGTLHNGWKLEQLNTSSAVFTRNGTRTELSMDPAQ